MSSCAPKGRITRSPKDFSLLDFSRRLEGLDYLTRIKLLDRLQFEKCYASFQEVRRYFTHADPSDVVRSSSYNDVLIGVKNGSNGVDTRKLIRRWAHANRRYRRSVIRCTATCGVGEPHCCSYIQDAAKRA